MMELTRKPRAKSRPTAGADVAGTGSVPPPPLLYAGSLVAGLLLRGIVPARLPRKPARTAGIALTAAGVLLGSWAIGTMREAGNELSPNRPVVELVTAGPYRYTRNPIYLSLALIYAGAAMIANAIPALLLLAGVVAIVDQGVVGREENYLLNRFGEAYALYKSRVRRWL